MISTLNGVTLIINPILIPDLLSPLGLQAGTTATARAFAPDTCATQAWSAVTVLKDEMNPKRV